VKDVRVGPSWSKLFLDVLLFCKAIMLLATRRYDIIHSHEEAAFFSVILAAMFRTGHVYDMHSSLPLGLAHFNFGNYRPIVKLFEVLERWVINTCDAVITVSSDLEQRVRDIYPAAKQIMVENLPIQTTIADAASPSVDELKDGLGLNHRLLIVYAGNFERYQGVDLLFQSAEIVKKHHSDILFLFVGGNPQQVAYWKDKARRKRLTDCILFVGTVPQEEVPAYLEMAEILVSPRTEGASVPLKIYTYLLVGKPIVATNLGAHTMVLNEELAVLVEPTAEAFSEGILELIHDPDLRQRLGTQAREFVQERYHPANCRAKLDQIYRMLPS